MNQSTQPTKQKLFISFSATLSGLLYGRFRLEDLNGGLIYFGCSRSHLEEIPSCNDEVRSYIKDVKLGYAKFSIQKVVGTYLALKRRVAKALDEGKAILRTSSQKNNYKVLDELLTDNGIFVPCLDIGNGWYDYPTIKRAYDSLVDVM